MDDATLLHELEPTAARLLDRHIEASPEWFPHELVPWSRGRDYDRDVGWDPDEYPVSDGVRAALFVNLLTEDNLPYYSSTIRRIFTGEAWQEWGRRWTAEEQRHSHVIRDYFMLTRALDPWELERARMVQVSGGETPQPPSVADGFVYLSLQELATRLSHRNTGAKLTDRDGYQVMARVASDENLHFLFYRDITAAALEVDPSAIVCAIERQVADFEMPGTGIPHFRERAFAIAREGIYDLHQHFEKILKPVVLRQWGLEDLTGLSAEAEAARERTLRQIDRVGRLGRRLVERRERQEAEADRDHSVSVG